VPVGEAHAREGDVLAFIGEDVRKA
jgi:hypothetical protein